MSTLFLAVATLAHVLAYEYGGKFNPIFPLMFLGPAVAGVLQARCLRPHGQASARSSRDHLGSLIVAGGGFMAMYTMYVAMKEAKVQGEIKAAAMREERKRQRAARRERTRAERDGPRAPQEATSAGGPAGAAPGPTRGRRAPGAPEAPGTARRCCP